ncbi:metal-dependent hydrolase [Erythrobacter ani]|uniref:Metal-dependent hydrolase n=1 Tax=Erythrobacter ani TaxID=2827235 RepID=A0ABS6SPH0_9SPHN|nr:metal-dependent hydrolase [Erythrobacter ani]MBV7266913.1 metal-dependent hydrolase [Erythrobacter ani]
MDNLTHSLVGALLGQTGLKKKTGLGMPALIIGANLPDVDAACFFWLEGTEHLGFRRGITHGPPAMVLLPLILAGLLWGFDRWQAKRGKRPEKRLPVHFGWLFALSLIGCLSHPVFDWFNVYGIRLLEPFSSRWFYGDTLFIIDVWLWAILIGSVWWSRRREKRGGNWQRAAWIGIIIGSVYVAANGLITKIAEEATFARTGLASIESPLVINSWERETIIRERRGAYRIDGDLVGQCSLGFVKETELSSQADAFLLWSRAPFGVRAKDGSVILYDARFYDPRARGRFSVALPDVECKELPAD